MAWLKQSAHWALLDQAIVSAGNFVIGVLMARSLNAESFAHYALAATVITTLSTVHRSLIAQPMNILGAQESRERRYLRYRNMLTSQRWILPVVAGLTGLIGMVYFPEWALLGGTMVFLMLVCLQDIVRRYHYTDGNIRQAVPGDVTAYGGQIAVIAALWFMDAMTVDHIFWLLSVPMAGAVWFAHRVIRGRDGAATDGGAPRATPRQDLLSHWRNAKWVVMSQLVWIGAGQLVPFQLSMFGNLRDVAHYQALNTVINVLNVFRQAMGNYLPGKASSIFAAGGRPALAQYLLQVGAFCGAATVVGFAGFWLVGDWMVDLFFGGKYQEVKPILPVLAAVHLLAMSSLVLAAGAQVLGTSRVMFTSNAVTMVITLAAGPMLIARWGLWGGVATFAIGVLLPLVVQAAQLIRNLR